MRSMWTAATGMKAQQFNIDTISHNLTNVNTTGYRSMSAEFQDLFYANIRRIHQLDETNRPVALEVGHGVRPIATKRSVNTQGSFMETNAPYDMALNGDAYFCIETPHGERYTRDGSFKISDNGDGTFSLVTNDGNYVLGDSGEHITFNAKDYNFQIAPDATMKAVIKSGKKEVPDIPLGKLKLVRFPNPQALHSNGGNLFSETQNSGEPIALTNENSQVQVAQGYLEASNVQVVDEMVKMITAQRAYEINSKAITTSDEMLQTANQIKR